MPATNRVAPSLNASEPMIKAATLLLGLTLLLAVVPAAYPQMPAEETAVNEAVYRQANRINLRQKLADARAVQARGDFSAAAKLYDDAWVLVQKIGSGVDAEAAQTGAGLAAVRLELARAAQHHGSLREAATQVDDVLRVDPGNAQAIAFKAANDKLLADQKGKMPSQSAESRVPAIVDEKVKASTFVQDGRLFFEMNKLDEAEAKLKLALKEDPQNQAAYYYLNLVKDARFKEALNKRDVTSRQGLVEVEEAWATPPSREALPVPNLYARTNLVFTSKGRQAILYKLDHIHLDSIGWDGLPLSEVVKNLSDEAKRRDPEKRGINFIINPNSDSMAAASAPAAGAVDPATGLPQAAGAVAEAVDISAISVKINPPLSDVRLADVLDAIVKVADKPIKYSIESYAVVFSMKGREAAPLFVRIIKVDPNTFEQGLESVIGFDFGSLAQASSGGSSGGSSGSSSSGSSSSSQGGGILTVARVNVSGGTSSGGGGSSGGGSSGGGISSVTRTNHMEAVQAAVRQFFVAMGVDLSPPKNIFFNDREGSLVVRATLQDLDVIETAVQVLNIAPPQVNIKTKFVEVSQNDTKALGFDWYLGNTLMNNGTMGLSGGTAPSYSGQPTVANPAGSFPGNSLAGTTIAPATSDGLLTSGLRSTVNNIPAAPAVFTLSCSLTDPQFRVVLTALDQRDGVDLLNEASVTTLSGRQTEIQVVDLQTIVTGTSLNQTASSSSTTTTSSTGSGVVGSTVSYPVSTLPFGPTLDVIPYVSADGFTVQMTIIPTITEFLGYDNPGQFVPQAQSVGAGNVAIPLTATLPLPHFRLRQVTTSAIVWDGQTVVLGGLITENVTKLKDKVPVLGDLPLVGVLFRSESSSTQRKNLIIFVTPTIIDPAGNRFHSEDEMPFAQNAIPAQRAILPAAQ